MYSSTERKPVFAIVPSPLTPNPRTCCAYVGRALLRGTGVHSSESQAWSAPSSQGRGRRGPEPSRLEVVAHDRARRYAASHRLESGAREGGHIASAGRARRQISIERIGFERGSFGPLCGFQRRRNQRRRHAPLAIARADIQAGQRPDRHPVHALEPPRAIKPRQGIARRELAPTNGDRAVEGEQARWWTALDDLAERRLVSLARPFAICTTDAPIHAPAAVAGAALAEQILERGPQIGRERADRQLHVRFTDRHGISIRDRVRPLFTSLRRLSGHSGKPVDLITCVAWTK